MSNVFRLGSDIVELTSSPKFDEYSKVIISVTDDLEYSAGTDTGRVLSLVCPWGTQKMAEDILASISGYKYQPYTAKGALLDPAAELGDGVSIRTVHGGVYSQNIKFGGLCSSDISAPEDEEIDHEYPYVPKQERKVTRKINGLSKSFAELKIDVSGIFGRVEANEDSIGDLKFTAQGFNTSIQHLDKDLGTLRSDLTVTNDSISAKVSQTGGDPSSFGWTLDSSSWKLTSNSTDVLIANKDGLNIKGKITATGGTIGGFTINGSSLSSNKQVWSGEIVDKGVYIGPEGIRLGKNFKVDNQGNLEAASGSFTGEVSASSIKYGKDETTGVNYGTLSGAAITSQTVSTTQLSRGINTSLGYADYANDVFSGSVTSEYLYGKKVQATETFQFGRYTAYVASLDVTDDHGTKRSLMLLGLRKM